MSVLASDQPLRPGPGGLNGWLRARAVAAVPHVLALARALWPVPRIGRLTILTRHDDVIEAFRRDPDFDTPYHRNIDVLTDGEPFILGMRDGAVYRADLAALRGVMLAEDPALLGDRAEALAEAVVARAGGRVEVVDALVRKVAFDLHSEYLGIAAPLGAHLPVWATRCFEFQFASSPNDHALRAEIDKIAPALRAHIDAEIARCKADPAERDDVLARCVARQRAGDTRFTDVFIRTQLLCMLVGGPPQLPMVAPQGLEQLLRRPQALRLATDAARAGENERLWRIVREAMRFDPLAPVLPRVATHDTWVAQGRRRGRAVGQGATVLLAFSSAMMDGRRVPHPRRFDPDRPEHEYIHFGHGLHECFGRAMNEATIARILKPLLRRDRLRRAIGAEGRLSKAGVFARSLMLRYD